jgi:hypothetical protein
MAPGGRLWSESPITPFWRPIGEAGEEEVVVPDPVFDSHKWIPTSVTYGPFSSMNSNLGTNWGPEWTTGDGNGILGSVAYPPTVSGWDVMDTDFNYGYRSGYRVDIFGLYDPADQSRTPWQLNTAGSTASWTGPGLVTIKGNGTHGGLNFDYLTDQVFHPGGAFDYTASMAATRVNATTGLTESRTFDTTGTIRVLGFPQLRFRSEGESGGDSPAVPIASLMEYPSGTPVTPTPPAGVELGSFYWAVQDTAVTIAPSLLTFTHVKAAGGRGHRVKFGYYYKWIDVTGRTHVVIGRMQEAYYVFIGGGIIVTPPWTMTNAQAFAQVSAALWPGDAIYGTETSGTNKSLQFIDGDLVIP